MHPQSLEAWACADASAASAPLLLAVGEGSGVAGFVLAGDVTSGFGGELSAGFGGLAAAFFFASSAAAAAFFASSAAAAAFCAASSSLFFFAAAAARRMYKEKYKTRHEYACVSKRQKQTRRNLLTLFGLFLHLVSLSFGICF
jgi:hypothetical protein